MLTLFNITYNFGTLHFAHCSTAHLSPPSWNSFVFKKKTLNFSASCKIYSLLNSAQLAVHLSPPSQTWPTRGCPWAGRVNGISPSHRRSPLGNGWEHVGGCLVVVLGVNVVSGDLPLTFSTDWHGIFVSCYLHWQFLRGALWFVRGKQSHA